MPNDLERISRTLAQRKARVVRDGIEGRAQIWDYGLGRWIALEFDSELVEREAVKHDGSEAKRLIAGVEEWKQ